MRKIKEIFKQKTEKNEFNRVTFITGEEENFFSVISYNISIDNFFDDNGIFWGVNRSNVNCEVNIGSCDMELLDYFRRNYFNHRKFNVRLNNYNLQGCFMSELNYIDDDLFNVKLISDTVTIN